MSDEKDMDMDSLFDSYSEKKEEKPDEKKSEKEPVKEEKTEEVLTKDDVATVTSDELGLSEDSKKDDDKDKKTDDDPKTPEDVGKEFEKEKTEEKKAKIEQEEIEKVKEAKKKKEEKPTETKTDTDTSKEDSLFGESEKTPEPEKKEPEKKDNKEEKKKEVKEPTKETKDEKPDDLFGDDPKKPDESKEKTKKEKSVTEKVDKPKKEKTTSPSSDIFGANAPSVDDSEFDLSPANEHLGANFFIYGFKGDGKTFLPLTMRGNKNAITFDNKTQAIREELIERGRIKPEDVTVYDGMRLIDEATPEIKLNSSFINWRYLNALVKKQLDIRDWTLIDGGEIFEHQAEMLMRHENGLQPYEGFANKNLWKSRKDKINHLFNICRKKSRNGIIWTAYTTQRKVVKDGEFVTIEEVPKWLGKVMLETDVVIRVESSKDKQGTVDRFATIESNKLPKRVQLEMFGGLLINGKRINVNDKGFDALVKKE